MLNGEINGLLIKLSMELYSSSPLKDAPGEESQACCHGDSHVYAIAESHLQF